MRVSGYLCRYMQYARSKLCNVLHVLELHRRLAADSRGITAYAVSPGRVRTGIFENLPPLPKALLSPLAKALFQTPKQVLHPGSFACSSTANILSTFRSMLHLQIPRLHLPGNCSCCSVSCALRLRAVHDVQGAHYTCISNPIYACTRAHHSVRTSAEHICREQQLYYMRPYPQNWRGATCCTCMLGKKQRLPSWPRTRHWRSSCGMLASKLLA